MAFAIEYQEDIHPFNSGWFFSDDPFRDLRGNNPANEKDRWRISDISVGGIERSVVNHSFTNRAGAVHSYVDKQVRNISVTFDVRAQNHYSIPMMRDYVDLVFETNDPFFFYEDWRPSGKRSLEYVINSKKYLVIKDDITFEKVGWHKIRVTVDLVTTDLPYSISTGSTQDIINAGGVKFSSGIFGWQEWLQFDEETQKYRHQMTRGANIQVFNPSTKKVKHFEACMHIKMSNFSNVASGAGVRLINRTNDSMMSLDRQPVADDIYEQRDNLLLINGFNEWNSSGNSFIELDTGWNEIGIIGANATVDYLFHFYN